MDAYERLKAPGCVDSNVELSDVPSPTVNERSTSNWFPEEAPPVDPGPEASETSWLPEDDNEFFWQELTEEELSQRQGLGTKEICLLWPSNQRPDERETSNTGLLTL